MAISEDLILRYSSTPLSSLSYSAEDSNMLSFKTRKFIELDTNEVVSGVLNNGRKYEHIKYVSTEIQIIISTDSLKPVGNLADNNDRLNFLKNWWKAKHKYIARVPANASLTYTGELNPFLASEYYFDYDNTIAFNYYEVITGGGIFPLSFINDFDLFPELTLNLKRVLPL